MAVLKRRMHMVNFRLSEDEYQYLKNAYVTGGARSISDFARAAICRSIDAHSPASLGQLDSRIRQLHDRVEALDRAVKELASMLANGNGPLVLAPQTDGDTDAS